MTGKRPAREAAVVLHRVPAALDAAHVGFVFTDVIGNGHCGARTCMAFAFDERQAAVGSARMPGSGSSWHPLPNATSFNSIWSSYCACRRHQGCHSLETETSVRRRFCWAALGQAACQYLTMWGVGRKEQWRVEKLDPPPDSRDKRNRGVSNHRCDRDHAPPRGYSPPHHDRERGIEVRVRQQVHLGG